MVNFEGIGFSHFASVAQMLSFTACIKTAANLMLGEKGSGFERASGSSVGFFYSILILHVRLESLQ